MTWLRCPHVILVGILIAGWNQGGRCDAADDLDPLELVDLSAAVCLEVPGAQARWTELQSSKLWSRLKEFPPAERFLSGPGFQKWKQLQDHVQKTTGNSLSGHLLSVCSESLVVAVYLPVDKPPQGVLIAQARDADSIKSTLNAWRTLEPRQDLKSLQHQGQAYFRRAKSAGSSDVVYYTIFGRTIAMSDQESLIQQIIERHNLIQQKNTLTQQKNTAGTEPKSLKESLVYQSNRSRLPADAAAFLFLNPRMWDRVVDEALAKSPDAAWFGLVFRQMEGIALSLRLDDEVVFDLVTDLGSGTSPQWKSFVQSTRGDVRIQKIPPAAVLAVSSRMDLTLLVQAWLVMSPDARTEDFARGRIVLKSLLQGRDLFADVLPKLLSDWTIVAVKTTDEQGKSPIQFAGRFALDSAGATGSPTLPGCVDNALNFGLTALGAVLSHQRGTTQEPAIFVRQDVTDSGTIRSLVGLTMWQPAYLVTSRQLLVASDKQVLASESVPAPDPDSHLVEFEKRYFDGSSQLVWLDMRSLHELLTQSSDRIAAHLASDPEGHKKVLKHLSKIREIAEVFDAAFVAAGFDERFVRIVFGAALDRSE